MKKPIVIGSNPPFLTGIQDEQLPQLPPGFTFIRNDGFWLLATNGEKTYFVREKDLILRRIADISDQGRTFGRLKVGMAFCDDTDIIPLA